MTTNAALVDRVRLELGDQATTFDITVIGNGTAVRYETGTYPLDGGLLTIHVDGVYTTTATVEERTGVVTFDTPPANNAVVRFQGTKYRYFGAVDLQSFVTSAIAEHTHNRTDDMGRQITLGSLPGVEEYPLALLGSIKALWALATDASFDIDINAPDGVAIPRSERYRQLLEQIDARTAQYKDICSALNIGLWRIEVFNLRRVSKMTGRLVPIYQEQEVESVTPPLRVYLPSNTLGGAPMKANSMDQDLYILQGSDYTITLDFSFDITTYTIKAQSRLYPDSKIVSAEFTVVKTDAANGVCTATLAHAQTAVLPLQSYWDVQLIPNANPNNYETPIQGRVFCERAR